MGALEKYSAAAMFSQRLEVNDTERDKDSGKRRDRGYMKYLQESSLRSRAL